MKWMRLTRADDEQPVLIHIDQATHIDKGEDGHAIVNYSDRCVVHVTEEYDDVITNILLSGGSAGGPL